ncbi:hypothetical protein Ahy_A05g021908 isoform B [Arachis hypogaea]|uniref:Uncharacterized protein n=1 Tax=Arachis hypogaea TaxID=3818 RepID=A0A445CYX1_ARAHY|nr:hypothetical protein Ahy_A05g021908 isoform B [Arachis hypogaea]
MGNCLLGGMSEPEGVIKVITSNGGIMEFTAPVTVNFITNEFPGHAIFPSHDLFWKPLSSLDEKLTSKNSTSTNSSSCRFWKVKLAITPEQLLEILSQETRTKELMESVRIVAKCGGVSSCAGSAAASIVSEDWSHSSSGRSVNSSKIDALVLDI